MNFRKLFGGSLNRLLLSFTSGRAVVLFLCATPAFAASPWENAVIQLRDAFTGPIAHGLALVAVVVGGLMYAFGENDSKRMLAGIVFGLGMALGAANFVAWL